MTRPDHVFTFLLTFFLLILASCAGVPTFTNYDGRPLSDQRMATLENRWGCPFCIQQISAADGTLLYDKKEHAQIDPFILMPGDYQIRISYFWPKIRRVSYEGTAKLKAGHVYRVKDETCYAPGVLADAVFGGTCHGRRAYTGTVWIEDTTTGEVVVGEKWD